MSLKVEALSYTYMKGTPFEKKALDNVTFEIETGEFVGIIGHTAAENQRSYSISTACIKPERAIFILTGS